MGREHQAKSSPGSGCLAIKPLTSEHRTTTFKPCRRTSASAPPTRLGRHPAGQLSRHLPLQESDQAEAKRVNHHRHAAIHLQLASAAGRMVVDGGGCGHGAAGKDAAEVGGEVDMGLRQ
jgi:hypothetical protein